MLASKWVSSSGVHILPPAPTFGWGRVYGFWPLGKVSLSQYQILCSIYFLINPGAKFGSPRAKFMALGAMFGDTKTELGRWETSLGLWKWVWGLGSQVLGSKSRCWGNFLNSSFLQWGKVYSMRKKTRESIGAEFATFWKNMHPCSNLNQSKGFIKLVFPAWK